MFQMAKYKFVPLMETFVVEGIKGTKRLVTINPKETCSCPSTGQCYHILAVKIAINDQSVSSSKQVKNLSQLKKKQ